MKETENREQGIREVELESINPYGAPASDVVNDERKASNPTVGIVVAAIITSFCLGTIGYLQTTEKGWDSVIGIFLGSLIPALVVVAVFQLWRRFRNRRSRWNIYATTQSVILISEISRYVWPQ